MHFLLDQARVLITLLSVEIPILMEGRMNRALAFVFGLAGLVCLWFSFHFGWLANQAQVQRLPSEDLVNKALLLFVATLVSLVLAIVLELKHQRIQMVTR